MKEGRKEQIRGVLKYQREVNGQISKMCGGMAITTIRDILTTDRPRHKGTDTDSVWLAAETILKERGVL